MRIIVPIKQVPETSKVKMDPITGTMIRAGLEAIINPLDLYAIEAALRLREQTGGQITVISMGPPQAEKALREAVAMGCDDGVLLSDRRFSGADTWATAYTLAQGIRKLGTVDLILCGERATDGDTGQVGPALAAMLGLTLITYVSQMKVTDSRQLHLTRLVEGGREILNAPLPALVTVVKEIAVPRLPTLRGMRRAKTVELPIWGPEDIDAEAENIGLKGSPTRVTRIHHPQVTRQGELVAVKDPNDVDAAVEQLVAFLQKRNLI